VCDKYGAFLRSFTENLNTFTVIDKNYGGKQKRIFGRGVVNT
jgi:hypothetical protein